MSNADRKIIQTDFAPAALGPYCQAVVSGGFLFSAGQVGLDPASNELVGDDVESQSHQVIANLNAVLAEAGLGFDDVVKSTIYLADMGDFAKVNAIYAEAFTDHPPARSTVAVAGLPLGARVEIDVVARLG